MSIPQPVKELIQSCEKVLFTATYLLADRKFETILGNDGKIASNVSTIPVQVETNPGYNLLVSVAYPIINNLIPPIPFIERNAVITSFKEGDIGVKVGQINAIALYQEGLGPDIISRTVQRYDVNSKSGIYSKVTGVIIDFSGPVNQPRTLYFISNCILC